MTEAQQQSIAAGERVLVVDDEPDILALVSYHLVKAGYRVSQASSGTEALAAAKQERPALIVLDLMLPGMSGYDVLEQLRAAQATKDIAVLMLTARREEPDRIRGLALGADDYLTKPFSPQELTLRVGAILRRMTATAGGPADVLSVGPITIDRAAHRVTVDDDDIELTPTEYKLLLTLAERRGRVQDARICSEWCGKPHLTSRRERSTCTCSGCAQSWETPVSSSRPSEGLATACAPATRARRNVAVPPASAAGGMT